MCNAIAIVLGFLGSMAGVLGMALYYKEIEKSQREVKWLRRENQALRELIQRDRAKLNFFENSECFEEL